jgi:hypothetical protein
MFTACDKSKDSYPSQIMWGDIIYSVVAENVPSKDIGNEIGEIRKKVRPLPKKNGESNTFEEGTKLYSIVGIDQQKSIAIRKDDSYLIATHY